MSRAWVLVALLAAGCSHAERDAARCHSYGWTAGTDGFAQCLQTADMQRRALVGAYVIHATRPAPATCQGAGNAVTCQ